MPGEIKNMPPIKFWNLIRKNDLEAELTLYGEVCESAPVDWWTGEKIDGLFVAQDEFIKDLDSIRDIANLTIRINSVGGDTFVGMGIYTQLKNLKAYKTVIVDGIAASAASLIAMAGDTIKIPTSALMMIHDPMAGICGWYNSSELDQVIKGLEATSAAIAETYRLKTGLEVKELRKMMTAETWMTGQEAIDKGFADVLLFDDGLKMAMSADKSMLMVNGIGQKIQGFRNIPGSIPITAVTPDVEPVIDQGGKQKLKTVEELRIEYPDLVSQIEAEARNQATEAERQRIKEIDEIQDAIMDRDLVSDAKYKNKSTAAQLAFDALKKQKALGAQHLADVAEDTKASGVEDVTAAPNRGVDPEEESKTEEEIISMIVGDRGRKEAK